MNQAFNKMMRGKRTRSTSGAMKHGAGGGFGAGGGDGGGGGQQADGDAAPKAAMKKWGEAPNGKHQSAPTVDEATRKEAAKQVTLYDPSKEFFGEVFSAIAGKKCMVFPKSDHIRFDVFKTKKFEIPKDVPKHPCTTGGKCGEGANCPLCKLPADACRDSGRYGLCLAKDKCKAKYHLWIDPENGDVHEFHAPKLCVWAISAEHVKKIRDEARDHKILTVSEMDAKEQRKSATRMQGHADDIAKAVESGDLKPSVATSLAIVQTMGNAVAQKVDARAASHNKVSKIQGRQKNRKFGAE